MMSVRSVICALALVVLSLPAWGQTASEPEESPEAEIKAFQDELNTEYKNKDKSPLDPKAFKKFKSHTFYPVDLAYRVQARLTLTPDSSFFNMNSSSGKPQPYRIYAYAEFQLSGVAYKLPVYQSQNLMKTEQYANYLFFPFTDATNGEETYGGGRYISLWIPKTGNELVIDFNQAYNPYCAYSNRYSCPIVPKANYINTPVRAGVRFVGHH